LLVSSGKAFLDRVFDHCNILKRIWRGAHTQPISIRNISGTGDKYGCTQIL
jgi:hypothetical protein